MPLIDYKAGVRGLCALPWVVLLVGCAPQGSPVPGPGRADFLFAVGTTWAFDSACTGIPESLLFRVVRSDPDGIDVVFHTERGDGLLLWRILDRPEGSYLTLERRLKGADLPPVPVFRFGAVLGNRWEVPLPEAGGRVVRGEHLGSERLAAGGRVYEAIHTRLALDWDPGVLEFHLVPGVGLVQYRFGADGRTWGLLASRIPLEAIR